MEDFAAGHITNEEAGQIILDLDQEIGTDEIQFYAGVSYRHLMVLKRRSGQVLESGGSGTPSSS